MKKIILQLVVLTFFMSSCSNNSDKQDGNSSYSCSNISDFTVIQNNENIVFNLVSTATPLFYELMVSNTSFSQIGELHTINSTSQSFTVDELGLLPGGTYVFSIRSACSDGIKSDWSPSKSLVVGTYCSMPYNISINGHSLIWSNSGANSSQYQVEYGLHGFALGTGTSATVNLAEYPYVAMQENQTYDFYVRANCSGSLGWSSWSGPYSYLCPIHYNDCNIPSNIGASIVRNFFNQATGANISWDFNGETSFEYTCVLAGQTADSGTTSPCGQTPSIYLGLAQNTNYHFYVRAICANGNKTNWAGPKLINIGF